MNITELFKSLVVQKKEKEVNRILVTKDKDGQWWFFGIYSNRFKDLDGEIISEKAHKEYIQWLNSSGFRPVITAYHLPRAKDPAFWTKVFDNFENNVPILQKIVDSFYKPLAFAKVERVVYSNGFTAVIAKFLPGKEQIAENLSKLKNMGMSHGFINRDSDANIFNKYRTFEMSILRSVRAANMFTLSGALQEKGLSMAGTKSNEKGLSNEDRAALAAVFGEDVVSKFDGETGKVFDILSRTLEFKESDDSDTEEEETEDKKEESPADEKKEEVTVDVTLNSLAEGTKSTFMNLHQVITEMQQKMQAQEEEIKTLKAQIEKGAETVQELKKSEDEKIASAWFPQIDWRSGYSASQSDKNLVESKKEKENLTEAAPEGTQQKPQNEIMGFALAPLFKDGLRG